MMVQLKRAGKLQRLAGLIIGGMLAMKDSTDMPFGKTIEELIMEHVGAYKYPIAFGMPISHAAPNLAFLHGAIGKLIVTEKSVRLSFGK
jgi:muramoyltetrapeptide carboxypeptidase